MNIIIKRYSNRKLVSVQKFKNVLEIKFHDLVQNSQATIYFKSESPYIYLFKKNESLKICNIVGVGE